MPASGMGGGGEGVVPASGMGGGGERAVPSLSNGVISRKYKGSRQPSKMVATARRVSPMHSGLREPVLFALLSRKIWPAMGGVGVGETWLGPAMLRCAFGSSFSIRTRVVFRLRTAVTKKNQ